MSGADTRGDVAVGPPAIHVRDLRLSFRNRNDTVDVLASISFDVAPGEFVVLIGPSGCGKSTLLKVAAGLVSSTRGICEVEGRRPRTDGRVAYMSQVSSLLPWRTVIDNVVLPMLGDRHSRVERRRRAMRLLDEVELRGFERRFPSELSVGMQKRVQLARTMAQEGHVLLMDEPFGALDAQTKLRIQTLFLRVWEEHRKTVLFVTHDLQEAIYLADRIVVFSERPARIIDSIVVHEDRPRRFIDMIETSEFQAIYQNLWKLLDPTGLEASRHIEAGHDIPDPERGNH